MRGSRVKFSELFGSRPALAGAMSRVYTILWKCRGEIRMNAPYDSDDAASLGALADGVHQGAQTIGHVLLRGGRRRPDRRRPSPLARPRLAGRGAPQSLS